MEVKDIDKILYLLYNEEWGCWISRNWCYELSKDVAKSAIEYYIETWQNALKEYDSIIYLWWYRDSDYPYNPFDYNTLYKCLEWNSYWDINSIYNINEIEKFKFYASRQKLDDEHRETYNFKRQEANTFIQNKKNRNIIFEKHWKECNYCWDIKNLSIDHIKPVSKWWDNQFNNLQVLCRSCNSSKSNKI
jgi:hypothetical protein